VFAILNHAVRFRITDHNTLGGAAGGTSKRDSGVLEGGLEVSGGVEASQASIVRLSKVKGGTEDMGGDGAMGRGSRGEAHASNGVADTAGGDGGEGGKGGHDVEIVGCGGLLRKVSQSES
jgi:hypothetical protein